MNKIIFWSYSLLLFCVPLFFWAGTSELFEFNKIILTYALTAIIFSSWLIKMITSKQINFKMGFLKIPLLIYLGTHIISTIFSIDPHISFWGYYSRWHEGLLASATYIFLYFAAINNLTAQQVKKMIFYSFVSTAIIATWGAFEHFGHSFSCLFITGDFNVSCWVQDVAGRVYATLGQPNWMAAYLVVQILIAIGFITKFQNPNSKIKTWNFRFVFMVLITLFFAALLFTKSRSGILGLGAGGAVFGIWYLRFNWKSMATILSLFLAVAISFGLPFGQIENLSIEKFLSPKVESTQPKVIDTGYIDIGISQSSDIRKIVWEGAVKVWQRYPIFGSGVETFALSYYKDRPVEHNMVSEWDFLYNKAHNEFLNLLATTGTVGFLAYLFVIANFIIWFIRHSGARRAIESKEPIASLQGDLTILGLFGAWISILVTNFFGFSVVIIGLYFFLIPAFIEILNNETK